MITLQKERIELSSVVSRAVELARPLINLRKHELSASLPLEPVQLEADPLRLAQGLASLLHSASQYTEEGGHIWLTAERREDQVVVRVKEGSAGVGKVPGGAESAGGTDTPDTAPGAGLKLVRHMVEMHGGSIETVSLGPGMGGEFVVSLPVLPESQLPAGSMFERSQVQSRRVLVVDDNVDAAQILGLLLESIGHKVQTAHDGLTALEAARVFMPDVVLLDVGLPRMDGYEVARHLRGKRETANVLLVALTGYGREEDRRRCHEAGFDVHLIKPIGLEALESLLARPNARRQTGS